MVFRVVIAGESQCDLFAQVCLLAEYLQQNLSDFCYKRIEKSVLDWKPWLTKINKCNGWHHMISPIIWKEFLIDGSKPAYIGSTQEFLEYCYSYYSFDVFLASEKFKYLSENYTQYEQKHKNKKENSKSNLMEDNELHGNKTGYTVCISGAYSYLTIYLVSGLLELCIGEKKITKIYIFDNKCSTNFVQLIENECKFMENNCARKIVKLVDKIGIALTNTDILIILDHVPFRQDLSIGAWLLSNKKIMEKIASTINICASSNIRVILPNVGPSCYNATILAERVTHMKQSNIVVATSDLGMNVAALISEEAEVPLQNMFCPPVWGFVGINHLIDVKTTIHRYDTFKPLDRYTKVKHSTLCIGTVTPEMRTMEYLFYFDETLWKKLAETMTINKKMCLSKVIAVTNTVKIWLCDPNPEYVINLGIICDGNIIPEKLFKGSFGLSFCGFFSQPAQLINGEWKPARAHLMPKNSYVNINYLEDIANLSLNLGEEDLPQLNKYTPCICKQKCPSNKIYAFNEMPT